MSITCFCAMSFVDIPNRIVGLLGNTQRVCVVFCYRKMHLFVFWFNLCSVGALPPRVYVGYSIYKGKAALTLTPRPPEFVPLDVCLFSF